MKLKELIEGSNIEYIIWGVPEGATEEVVLYTKADTPEEADRVMGVLGSKHGCTKMHVQELDLSAPPDFTKVFS